METEKKYYDQGWNDFIDGVPYDPKATEDWKDGWFDCNCTSPERRVKVD